MLHKNLDNYLDCYRPSICIYKMSIQKSKKLLRRVLLRSIPKKIKDLVIVEKYKNASSYYNDQIQKNRSKCYSQNGEDLVLKRCFHQKQDGFYEH